MKYLYKVYVCNALHTVFGKARNDRMKRLIKAGQKVHQINFDCYSSFLFDDVAV